MNVLFLHSSSELYGSDRSLLNIIKNIDKDKFNVFVVLPYQGPLVEKLKEVPEVKVEIYDIAVLRRKNLSVKGAISYIKDFFCSYFFLRKYIISNNIEIIDTNTAVVFPGAIAAKHLKRKSVWHIREIINNKKENCIISWIMNRYADIIVANSITTGNFLNVNQKKIRVIYNAVEEINVEHCEHDRVTIGMAGRINRWKGQKLFVDAAEIVTKECNDVVFLIAGNTYNGEEFLKKELIDYIDVKGLSENVLLVGQVDDMTSFYSSLDIFVLPSIQPEPFGLVVIEAMDFAIPVVATNHGGPTEIITDGVDGYLVDYKSAEEMADKIIELVNNKGKRIEIGEKGKKKKREAFSVEAMTRGIEKIFFEVRNN